MCGGGGWVRTSKQMPIWQMPAAAFILALGPRRYSLHCSLVQGLGAYRPAVYWGAGHPAVGLRPSCCGFKAILLWV